MRSKKGIALVVGGALLLMVGATDASVSISSPSNGASVNGTVTVKAQISNAYWSKLWVDGKGIDSAGVGNVSFTWSTGSFDDGYHTLTVKGYPYGSTVASIAQSITVDVDNQSSTPTSGSVTHFYTLPESASLPSDSTCATEIPWEREMVPANEAANNTKPTSAQLTEYRNNGYAADTYNGTWAYARVDGQYTGTTDMIFRWAACKWGVDEDVVRAQATEEHWNWVETVSGGDKRLSESQCVNGDFSLWNYQCSDCCYTSWGNFQTKVINNWQTWPMMDTSTAFSADYRFADQRACMNGDYAAYFATKPIYNGHSYGNDIASGNLSTELWGCIGAHYSGNWYDGNSTQGAIWYMNLVKQESINKSWKTRWPSVNWPD